MEMPCSVGVQVGLPSAPYGAMPQSPMLSVLPPCPQMHVEGKDPPERETAVLCFLVSVSIYTCQAFSAAPLLCALTDPFLLQKLMSCLFMLA